MVYGKRGRADEALEALATAEKLDPNFEMTYVYRGNVYATTGQMPLAIAEYQRAVTLNPKNATAQQGPRDGAVSALGCESASMRSI